MAPERPAGRSRLTWPGRVNMSQPGAGRAGQAETSAGTVRDRQADGYHRFFSQFTIPAARPLLDAARVTAGSTVLDAGAPHRAAGRRHRRCDRLPARNRRSPARTARRTAPRRRHRPRRLQHAAVGAPRQQRRDTLGRPARQPGRRRGHRPERLTRHPVPHPRTLPGPRGRAHRPPGISAAAGQRHHRRSPAAHGQPSPAVPRIPLQRQPPPVPPGTS
jgi:hypothetical protein